MPWATWAEAPRGHAGQRAHQVLGSIWKSFSRFSAQPLAGLAAPASSSARSSATNPTTTAIYDCQGVLRFAGRDHADCVAYAELFGLDLLRCSITSLGSLTADAGGSVESLALPALA
jgi:hypothetical protein